MRRCILRAISDPSEACSDPSEDRSDQSEARSDQSEARRCIMRANRDPSNFFPSLNFRARAGDMPRVCTLIQTDSTDNAQCRASTITR